MIPHYSPPNTSSDWRRVIVIRYLAADCRLGREAYQDFRTGAGFPRECTHTTEATCHHNPPAGLLAHPCSPSKKKRRADFLVAGEDTKGYGCRRSPFEPGEGYRGDSRVVSMAQHEGTPAVEEGVRVLGSPRL